MEDGGSTIEDRGSQGPGGVSPCSIAIPPLSILYSLSSILYPLSSSGHPHLPRLADGLADAPERLGQVEPVAEALEQVADRRGVGREARVAQQRAAAVAPRPHAGPALRQRLGHRVVRRRQPG